MYLDDPWVLAVAGLVVLVTVVLLVFRPFSKDVKVVKRRRRSNFRIVSKGRQPTVRFSVRTDKKR